MGRIGSEALNKISELVDWLLDELERLEKNGNKSLNSLINDIKTESFCLFELAEIQPIHSNDLNNLVSLLSNAKSQLISF